LLKLIKLCTPGAYHNHGKGNLLPRHVLLPLSLKTLTYSHSSSDLTKVDYRVKWQQKQTSNFQVSEIFLVDNTKIALKVKGKVQIAIKV